MKKGIIKGNFKESSEVQRVNDSNRDECINFKGGEFILRMKF